MIEKEQTKQLPLLGIGPIYVITCLIMTLSGLYLQWKGILSQGIIVHARVPLAVLGTLLVLLGMALWIYAVLIQKVGREIKANHLVTDGVFSVVRNPIYSAFLFIFTGILFMAGNRHLLFLPVIFYVFLTLLLRETEEKWLKDMFGQEYVQYCQKVNRVFPWWPRSTPSKNN